MTPQELIAYIEGLIIDNTTQQISPYKMRSVLVEMVNSLNQSNISSLSAVLPLNYDPFTNTLSLPVVNNLTSGGTNAVLSAEQGKILKQLIDDIVISGGGVTDAPNDGKLYARKSLSWVEANLQSVTDGDGNNVTTNALVVTSNDGDIELINSFQANFIEQSQRDVLTDETERGALTLVAGQWSKINILEGEYRVDMQEASNAVPTSVTRILKAPILTADETIATHEWTQPKLDLKADLVGGLVPSSQLPATVDEILEFANLASFPATGVSNFYYLALDTNKTYRWSGSGYVALNEGIALGETSSTAYRGDRGKTAYDHSLSTSNPHNVTKSQLGLANVDNTTDLNKPISTATQTALDLKVGQAVMTDTSATSTIVGWSSFTFKFIREYNFGNGFVLVEYFIDGTSNSTTTSFTLSNNNISFQRKEVNVGYANNGADSNTLGAYTLGQNANVVVFTTNNTGTTFAGSNRKAIRGTFIYYKG